MNRDQFLNDRLRRFLTERRVPPRSLSTPAAQAEEIKALNRIVLARAPREEFEEWWDEVERFIGSHADTRAWPTEKEMLTATAAARVPGKAGLPREEWKIDSAAIAAQRIREGKPVGDDWLWGRLCLEMLGKGLCSEHDLQRYRDAFAREAEATCGKELAEHMLEQRRARHRDAMAVERGDLAYFTRGDGSGRIRPRMMPGMTPSPDWKADREALVEPDAAEVAARPYTDAELARIRALRPHDTRQEAAQ